MLARQVGAQAMLATRAKGKHKDKAFLQLGSMAMARGTATATVRDRDRAMGCLRQYLPVQAQATCIAAGATAQDMHIHTPVDWPFRSLEAPEAQRLVLALALALARLAL